MFAQWKSSQVNWFRKLPSFNPIVMEQARIIHEDPPILCTGRIHFFDKNIGKQIYVSDKLGELDRQLAEEDEDEDEWQEAREWDEEEEEEEEKVENQVEI